MGLADAGQLTDGSQFFQFELPRSSEKVPDGAYGITAFWLNTAAVAVHGFAVSLFWTLATIAYFVVRKTDDGTALDEVFLWDEAQPDALLPLVGVAASEQPVVERPLEKEPSDNPPEPESAES